MAPSLTRNTNKKRNFSTAKCNPPPRKTKVKSTRTVKVTTMTKMDNNNNKDTSPKQMDRKKEKADNKHNNVKKPSSDDNKSKDDEDSNEDEENETNPLQATTNKDSHGSVENVNETKLDNDDDDMKGSKKVKRGMTTNTVKASMKTTR